MPLEIAMKTEELLRALALDATLPRKLNAAVGMAAAVGTSLAVMLFFMAIGFRPAIERFF